MNVLKLKKEDLDAVKFSTTDVLHEESAKKILMADLFRAQSLGNLEKTKVKIIFHMQDNSRGEVETTVWGVGENHLMLKGGLHIPIRAIESILIV